MQDNSFLITIFGHQIDITLGYIKDFEEIMKDRNLQEKLSNASRVYAYMIILNVTQILSGVECDIYGIKQIENICSGKLKKELAIIKEEFPEELKKNIIRARNSRGVHIDKEVTLIETEEKIHDPCILFKNLEKIKIFLSKLENITKQLSLYEYEKIS